MRSFQASVMISVLRSLRRPADGSHPVASLGRKRVGQQVEQAAADELDRPYRQRIYRLSQIGPNRYQSEVFELPNDPLRYAGAWRTPAIFTTFGPTELTKREGCAIRLTAGEDVYIGRTEERSCPSTLRGASWATSEVILQEQQLTSWDRGWDDAGNQVWGATEQGYRFEKLASVALEDFEDDV